MEYKKIKEKVFSIDIFIKKIEDLNIIKNAPVEEFVKKRGSTPFKILISTLLSSRTKDTTTILAVERLFKLADNPKMMIKLDQNKIICAIYPVGFYRVKASRIMEISHILLDKYDGFVPDKINSLIELPGVGRKTANLVLLEAFNILTICVDTHVHRISNRINYIKTSNPIQTEIVLKKILPKKYWKHYNKLLVAFGQTICKPISPICTKCPVMFMCKRIGVKKFR